MDEVLNLTTLHVDDKDTHVVGSQPHPTALIHAHIPHLETCWQRGYAILCQIIVEMGVPFLILLVVHKHMAHVQHPVVAMLIHIAVIRLTRLSAIQLHKVVALDNLALLAIDNHQVAIGRGDQQLIVPLGKVREVVLLGNLVLLVAIFDELIALFARVVAIQTLVVGLNPETLLRVDIETVDITFDTPLRQHGFGVAVHLLGKGVEQTVVHALLEPQHTVGILPDLVYQVVTQRGGIGGIGVIDTETVAIVTVQTVRCANPDKATRILKQVVDL